MCAVQTRLDTLFGGRNILGGVRQTQTHFTKHVSAIKDVGVPRVNGKLQAANLV